MSIKRIREYCVGHCMNAQSIEVRLCPSQNCPLWLLRFGKGSAKLATTPLKAIHAKCVDCSDGVGKARGCPHPECVLHPFRMGRRLSEDAQWRTFSTSEAESGMKHLQEVSG